MFEFVLTLGTFNKVCLKDDFPLPHIECWLITRLDMKPCLLWMDIQDITKSDWHQRFKRKLPSPRLGIPIAM